MNEKYTQISVHIQSKHHSTLKLQGKKSYFLRDCLSKFGLGYSRSSDAPFPSYFVR